MKKTKNKKHVMDFESTIKQFLGDKAGHIEDSFNDPVEFKKWLRKCIAVVRKRIDLLDTTTRHKKMLFNDIEKLDERIKNKEDSRYIILALFSLISRLIGFDYQKGACINTPFYCQTKGQYYTQEIFEGGDVMQDYYDLKNLVIIRKSIYKILKDKNFSDFKIAQVLNTTEYQIKKLKNNL